nr:MAG TPA: PLxRFG domain protein [Caudoviricetes sp.]
MSALGDELEKRFISDYGSIENVDAHVGRAVDAKMAQTNNASTWQDALRSVKNNFVGGLEDALGGALNFIGAQIAPDAEFTSSADPMSSHLANGGWGLWNDPSKKAPGWGSEALLGAGQGLMQDAQERVLQDGNLYYQGSLTDRLTNPDYWMDRRGLLADVSNVLGSTAPFLAAAYLTRGASLPFMGDLLGGLGRGAAALAERGGVQGLLGNAAELGVNALNAGARYAAFSAPVTAISNAGSIYSDLLDQGYSPNEIAAQMRAMAWEEFPQDIATGIMDGVLLDGGVGRLLKGGGLLSRAGKGLASVGLGGAGEYYDELNQQIIQDKYTNKPYGTWLNPTEEEAAAAASAALGGGLFGLSGIARNAARNTSALTPAAKESGGAVTPGSAADPVANGLIASQIAATNAAVEGAQRQALAQALAGLQARPADTHLDIPEMQEPSAKASGGAGGSGATGQAVAVQGAASGAASDATNAKERLWNAILPYAKKYNVDPRLVLAQLSHESANFDSDLARSANNYGGLTTTENTGMPQPDGNMQYARFSSPEDFVDHYFKWWGDTIKDSGSDVDAFTSKLKNEGYFGADLGSYTQAVKRHMSSLEKEGYTAAAEAKPVSGGAENAGTTENAGGVGYIASGSDAWDGFDGRYVGASSAFSQSNYDNMGKVHPETIAGVNALASEYFKRTGKKLLLNSLAGGDHPSNASEWGHAAGWKADIDNTGVDTKVFLDICEELGIGAALEKDTHFDLSFGKGNAYMSTDQGTSDRTGSRWYEAYHSGKAAGKQGGSASANTSADEAQGLSAAQIAKLLDEGDGKQQASGVPKQFFSAFYNDVGSATTNQQLIMALDSMTNAKGEFMNTRENREQLARQFPNEVQAYALQLMREGAKPQSEAPEAPHTARRIYPRPAATPHITGNIPQAGQTAALQRAARPDGGDVTSSPVASPAAMTLEAERNAPQAERNAPQTGIQEARLSPAEETRTPAAEQAPAHTGNAAPAEEQAPAHIDNALAAIRETPAATSGTPSLERNEQPSGALNTEGAKLTPEHAAFTRTIGSGQGEGAEPQESDKVRPRSMQAMAADAQQANTPHLQPADRWQGTEQVQAADTPASAQDAGAPLPTVNPTVLTALATEARSRDGRRRQGRAILDTAKAFGVDLPVPLRRVLQAGEAKKAIREAQKMLRAAGVTANAENTAGQTVRPAAKTEARTSGEPAGKPADAQSERHTGKQTEHPTEKRTESRTEELRRESAGERTGEQAARTEGHPAQENEGRETGARSEGEHHTEETEGRHAQTERHAEERGAKFSADLSDENAAERGNPRTMQDTRAEAHTESTEGIKKDHTETVREITEEEKKEYALPAGYRTESGRDVFDAKPNEFILRPNGSKNFGEIPEAIEKATGGKVKAAPVRLKAGNIGSGYIHLAVKHGGQMAMKGYTVMDFINHTLQNFNQVYSQQTEKRPNRFAVYCKGDEAKGFIPVDLEIEQGEGNYYNIVSAMPHRDNIKGLVLFDGSATPSADTTNGTLIQDGNNNGGVASQSAFRKSTSPIKNSISQNTEGRKNESIPKKKKADELGEYSTTLKDILRKNPELADSLSDAQYQQVLVHMKNNNGTVKDGVYTFPTNRDKKNFSATVFAILHEINRNGKASLRGDAAKLHKMIMEAAPVLNEALTKQQKNIAALGDRMGTPVVWVDGAKGLNGFHADGVTFLNRRAGMSLPKVFWHESFHYMRAHNPALYDAIAAHVQEAQRITPAQINGYRRKLGRHDLSDADIIEEMLADKMQDVSERAGFFKAMAIENRSLAARAAAWIRRMIDRFVEHFRGANDRLSEKQTAAMARAFSAVMRDMKGADGLPLFRVRGTYVRTAQGAEFPALSLQGRASENKIKFSVNFEENQRVNRSFLDRIAERFGRQLGLKADRIITEERQTNRERNMTLLDYLFSSPSRVAEKYQLFRAFFNIGDRAYNLLTERRTYFNKKLDTAMRLAKKKEDYEDLRAVLLAGDAEQKEYTKAELLADGVKENVADAYLGVRETLKELYNMANEAHRRPSVHTRNGLTQAQVDDLKANKFVRILRQDADAAGKFSVTYREYANRENTFADVTPEALKGMQADEAMQILEATKNAAGTYTVKVREGRPALHELTGYIPHFFHEYMVRVTDASGKILRTIGSGRTEREAVTFAKAWQKENALADGEVLRIAPKTFDWTQAGLDERQYAPIMGDMDYYAMVNKLAENTGQTVKEAEEMLSGAVRLKTRHRFFGNAQHRKGVNGFEKEDLNWILRHYANSACRYYAMETEGKPKLINLYERVFGAFDKDPSTTLGRYTKQYINDLNGNPSDLEKAINETLDRCPLYRKFFVARYGERAALAVAGKLSGTIASLCLGFGNVSTALLNFTQAINGTAYIGEAKAYWQIFHEGARRRFTAEEQRVLNETNVENDVGMDSGAGYDKARYSVGTLWGKVTRAGMFFFKESEGIVRRGTVLTAYKTARKRGMSHDQAILFAKEVNRKSNFEYAVTDAPNIFRRGSVFAQLALQFKKYPIKQMEVVWDMLPRRHDTKIKTKQKILFWVPYFLTSGLLGIPAFGLPDDWFDDKFSLSLKKYLMEWAGNDRAKRMAAEIALYGAPSLLGADVSNRVGLGDIIPTQGRDIAGPAVSKLLSFGRDAFNGDGASALRDVSPGLYNIYAAFGAGESSGKRGRTNNRYLTAQDRLLRAMGFRSVKESTASDVSRIETMEKKDAAAEKQKAVDAYIEEPTSENKAKLKELGVKDKTVETERKKKGQTRLERTRDTLSKKDQKAKKDQALFDFADEK